MSNRNQLETVDPEEYEKPCRCNSCIEASVSSDAEDQVSNLDEMALEFAKVLAPLNVCSHVVADRAYQLAMDMDITRGKLLNVTTKVLADVAIEERDEEYAQLEQKQLKMPMLPYRAKQL